MYLSSNLKLLRKNRKLSQEDVSKKIGLTRSSYSGYENGVAEPGIENLVLISEFYKIPLDDIIKKDLAQLKATEWEAISKGVYVDMKGHRLRILTSTISENNEELIEMIPEKARAGYTLGYADPDYIKILPTFNLPFLSKNKKYRSFPISGDSMPPVSSGSHVIGEYIQNWESIKSGQPYIVITKDDGIVFKLIHKIKGIDHSFQLSSTNPVYEPYLVKINDILEVWKFVNYISNDLPDVKIPENDLVKSVKEMQNEVHKLKNFIRNSK